MKKVSTSIIVVILFLIGLRLMLPYLVKNYVNTTLSKIEGYQGHVEDIDLYLWRGAYEIKNPTLKKTSGKVPVPFFSSSSVHLTVSWRDLWHGALVAKMILHRPKLNFVSAPSKAESQTSVDNSWKAVVQKLFPLRFDTVEVKEGEIHYRDFHSDPKVDVALDHIDGLIKNLTNSRKISKTLIAELNAQGRLEQQALVTVKASFDPYKKEPTFSLDASVKDLELIKLNDLLRAYGNFDVEGGKFELYTELTSSERSFKGYVKPLLTNVKVVSLKKDSQNVFQLLWEGVVSFTAEILKNHSEDQIASKIPLEGKFENPDIDTWQAIGSLLSNAFIRALLPGIEETVHR